jgi:hypothetical protein
VAAAAAWEIEHRRLLRADLPEKKLRIEKLADLRYDAEALATIERGLRDEWGSFALLGFESVEAMAAEAGQTIFVARQREDDVLTVRAVVQTMFIDAHGEAERLREEYPTFQALTSREAWRRSRKRGGDTAVLLQITVFDERGGGLGSLLRNTALNLLPKEVSYALTATPLDVRRGKGKVHLGDEKTYTPAMRFHARAGAEATIILPGYKADAEAGSKHGEDVVVMRYARDGWGEWPAPKPLMRLRSVGPMQERLTRTARRLRTLRLRRVALPRLHLRAA